MVVALLEIFNITFSWIKDFNSVMSEIVANFNKQNIFILRGV